MKLIRRHHPAFTLIEVVLALSILVLLAGALFSTVKVTMETTAVLQQTQQFRQKIFGFFTLVEETFRALPASALLVWGTREEQGLGLPEIILREAPGALAWGERRLFSGEIALVTRAEANRTITLGLERREVELSTGQMKPNPPWLPLLTQLKKVQWRFFDSRNGNWQEFWNDGATHPTLIELSLEFEGETERWSHVFWLPPLQTAGGTAP
jgi:Prokaryotic N-terminal methylation motif